MKYQIDESFCAGCDLCVMRRRSLSIGAPDAERMLVSASADESSR